METKEGARTRRMKVWLGYLSRRYPWLFLLFYPMILAAGPYSATVKLPVTPFSLRANSVEREPEIQRFWSEGRVYEGLSQNNPGVSAIKDTIPFEKLVMQCIP
jgi:hypothetical protein